MKLQEQQRRPKRLRARWAAFLIAGTGLVPVVAVFMDWSNAFEAAQASANNFAFNRAAVKFRGGDWRWHRRAQGLTSEGFRIVETSVHEPPAGGAYAGAAHATHVEVAVEWQPFFHFVMGGPYHVSARATAAILRNGNGQWMPIWSNEPAPAILA